MRDPKGSFGAMDEKWNRKTFRVSAQAPLL